LLWYQSVLIKSLFHWNQLICSWNSCLSYLSNNIQIWIPDCNRFLFLIAMLKFFLEFPIVSILWKLGTDQ
jgi:hypothetical protein